MIRQISGLVLAADKNALVVRVGGAGGGLGLRVFVPETTRTRFRVGHSVELHTFLQVRETEMSLYGFESQEELEIFELLLGVSGVGPKVALSCLSTLAPDTLRLAVANKEPAILARVPGIGKRTAEKIALELKGKLTGPEDEFVQLAAATDADGEVMEALTSLGYSVVEAQRALQRVPADATGVEERLRLALSQFSD